MANHYNESEIRAACAEARRGIAHLEAAPGEVGCQARMTNATMETFHLAMAAEIGRGATAEELASAIANIASNHIHTLAHTIEADPEDQLAIASYITDRIMQSFDGRSEHLASSVIDVDPVVPS